MINDFDKIKVIRREIHSNTKVENVVNVLPIEVEGNIRKDDYLGTEADI